LLALDNVGAALLTDPDLRPLFALRGMLRAIA